MCYFCRSSDPFGSRTQYGILDFGSEWISCRVVKADLCRADEGVADADADEWVAGVRTLALLKTGR